MHGSGCPPRTQRSPPDCTPKILRGAGIPVRGTVRAREEFSIAESRVLLVFHFRLRQIISRDLSFGETSTTTRLVDYFKILSIAIFRHTHLIILIPDASLMLVFF